MIHVLATIQLQTGQREAFLDAFRQVMPLVHQEQGCIEYGPGIDADSTISVQTRVGDNSVVIIEKWDSLEALAAHTTAPHMLDYRQKVKDLVISTTINILQPA